ncbi:unnamed protein product [Schistocephalus solidus]|uniref:SUN domain-containing protein n=1 Tax=Schistocephalus solidus TaxID=70667 RepID=A0A183T7W9_SCHSO|nr:unnamed protein product [Schistocephalus solidus]
MPPTFFCFMCSGMLMDTYQAVHPEIRLVNRPDAIIANAGELSFNAKAYSATGNFVKKLVIEHLQPYNIIIYLLTSTYSTHEHIKDNNLQTKTRHPSSTWTVRASVHHQREYYATCVIRATYTICVKSEDIE